MIPLCDPKLDDEMKQAILDAVDDEPFLRGESVFKFEEEFARYIGTKYAVSVGSGTAALHLSLLALGLRENDHVLTTPMSFVATANAVLHARGVQPIFTDIDDADGNIDLRKDFRKRGLWGAIPVHLYGNPCDMEKVKELMEMGLTVVEDVCQGHGAEWKGKKVGTFGDAAAFSLYPTKNMTVGGDGGMVTTDNEEVANRIRCLRDCGRIGKYVHGMIGFTSRLDTIKAAVGRVQLRRLDEWNEKRRRIAGWYRERLGDAALRENGKCVYHQFVIRVKERDELVKVLETAGVQTGIHYPIPIHLQPVYGYRKGSFPVAEKFAKEILSLPMYPELEKEDVDYICDVITEVI